MLDRSCSTAGSEEMTSCSHSTVLVHLVPQNSRESENPIGDLATGKNFTDFCGTNGKNQGKSLALLGVLLAVVRYHDHNQLGEERAHVTLHFRLQSITEESQRTLRTSYPVLTGNNPRSKNLSQKQSPG